MRTVPQRAVKNAPCHVSDRANPQTRHLVAPKCFTHLSSVEFPCGTTLARSFFCLYLHKHVEGATASVEHEI